MNLLLFWGEAMKKKLFYVILVLLAGVCGGCRSLIGGCNKPLIGVTSVYEPAEEGGFGTTRLSFAYVKAVSENGGAPVVLPTIRDERAIERYLTELDGLVLIGGADIPPQAYGQPTHETVVVMSKERYDFESRLIERWLAADKPVLGVCLGMQFTNVVTGGSMIQDIPSQIGKKIIHRQSGGAYHKVIIEPNCLLARILEDTEATVYSSHHQAVDKLGANLKAVAKSEDGVIEALERTDGSFRLFVQWHPEMMDDLKHRDAIYGAFVNACRN